MKRIENLVSALNLSNKKPAGTKLYQRIDVEQIVVKKGEIYLLQRITYQILARRGTETSIFGEFTIEVDYFEEAGKITGKPRIEVEPIGFAAEAPTPGR